VKLSLLRFSDADQIEGAVTDRQRAELDRQVREARVQEARRQTGWTELAELRLVRRGPFLVDSEDDVVYTLRRGSVFEPDRATVAYVPSGARMIFYVSGAGDVVFLERFPGAVTWSEVVARKPRR
jgi:hypothetical protein